MDDLTYDVVTVLHAKARALDAYERYLVDAEGDPALHTLFEQMRAQDARQVAELQAALAVRLGGLEEARPSGVVFDDADDKDVE